MISQPIKTGLLSYGMSGQLFHAPFIAEDPNFELRAVVERTTKKAKKTYPDIISYDRVDALFEDETIDLVVVNTPNFTHVDFAEKALKHNKHVLVEKPFAVTVSEAKSLFKLAKEQEKLVMPYQNRRYDNDFESVKKIYNSGKLGNLVEAHFRFDRYKLAVGNKDFKETQKPGSGLAYDLGSHLLDQAISLFGKPNGLKKHLGYFRPDTKVDDYANFVLTYDEGFKVTVTASLLVADPQPAYVLHATKGSFIKHRTDVQEDQLKKEVSVSDKSFGAEESNGVLTTIDSDGQKSTIKIPSGKGHYQTCYQDVFETIRNQKAYPVSEEQIIAQLEILES